MTLEEYKTEFEALLNTVEESFAALGEKLTRAEKDLSAWDYKALWKWLRSYGFTEADLKAAYAIGTGELDKRLFLHGTRSSKVMSLSREDQDRLLTDEKFEVYDNFGRIVRKSWLEMSTDMRNRLLGDKGGHIHLLHEQRQPGAKQQREIVYTSAGVYQDRLRLNGGSSLGSITIPLLVSSISEEELRQLLDRITELRDEKI